MARQTWQERKATIAYKYFLNLPIREWEDLLRKIQNERSLRAIYGRAIVEQMEKSTILMDQFGKR